MASLETRIEKGASLHRMAFLLEYAMHLVLLLGSDHKTVIDYVADGNRGAEYKGLQHIWNGHEHVDGI